MDKSSGTITEKDGEDHVESQDLENATSAILQECRMVLPGVQTLFGFQLIAVFNERFHQVFTEPEEVAHLVALVMSALSVAFLMGPAAYHRQAHPRSVSREHVRASSWMLTIGMLPLMLAILIDIYLVTRVILTSITIAAVLTAILAVVFIGIWIVYPRYKRYQRRGTVI